MPKKKMKTLSAILTLLMFFNCVPVVHALDFKYKKIESFKVLDTFNSVAEFESQFNEYTQSCLDNTGGGTGGIPCFVSYDLWDRELNIIYKRLMEKLSNNEKVSLKESQLAWLKTRDVTNKLLIDILDKKYNEQGTMFMLMRAGDINRVMSPIVKERVLTLRNLIQKTN